MALKTPNAPKNEVAPVAQNPLALMSQSANLFDVGELITGDLFPGLKIPYPIEMGTKNPWLKLDMCFKVGIYDGSKFDKLEAPYIMSCIAAREASRKLVGPDKDKKYERAYRGGESNALFEQHKNDKEAQNGASYLVTIFRKDGSVGLAEFQCFKSLKSYWGVPFKQGMLTARLGVQVVIEDHSGNLSAVKGDDTKQYLDGKKFTGWKIVDIDPELVQQAMALLEENKTKFDAWLKR